MTYDQFGEPESEQEDQVTGDPPPSEAELAEHKKRCSGWVDRDADHPKPCLRCRPHLAPEERRRAMGLGGKK